jgi:tetratricopeptide (TPR) repeat protein
VTDDARREARELYEAGDFERSRNASLTGLELDANDLELLRLAGKSGVELDTEDAVGMLQKVVALNPNDAIGWHDLGEALAAEGRVRDATDAFRRAVELRPDDAAALIDYGHSAFASGQPAEAIEALEDVLKMDPSDSSTLRSLIGMYRRASQTEAALGAAERLLQSDPDDPVAALEKADLALTLGRLDEADGAYERLRTVDDEPEHDVYALHGLIQVAMRREDWDRALALAEEAIKVDTSGRTAALLGFFVTQARGRGDQPGRAEVEEALSDSHTEHLRIHSEEFAGF